MKTSKRFLSYLTKLLTKKLKTSGNNQLKVKVAKKLTIKTTNRKYRAMIKKQNLSHSLES